MRNKFKLLVHESTGQKYQDLFVKIMGYADPSFKAVKVHGNIGDRGNDGWSANSGKYFQVYAPEDLPSNDPTSIKKINTDFEKLAAYWNSISPIRQYHFVVNDKYKGASPHIYKAISDLKTKHNLEDASIFLASDLENLLFAQNQDVINSILGTADFGDNKKSIYQYLVDELTRKMYLQYWPNISENLIANTIESSVVDGFAEADILVFKTILPNTIPSFEFAVKELLHRGRDLCSHFTHSEFAYLSDDLKWWRGDMRWKKVWIEDQNEYHKKYDFYDNWRIQLYDLHFNFVHALNLFASEVRSHIYPQYFMGQQFTVVDSMGTYNGLQGYEALPGGYREIN